MANAFIERKKAKNIEVNCTVQEKVFLHFLTFIFMLHNIDFTLHEFTVNQLLKKFSYKTQKVNSNPPFYLILRIPKLNTIFLFWDIVEYSFPIYAYIFLLVCWIFSYKNLGCTSCIYWTRCSTFPTGYESENGKNKQWNPSCKWFYLGIPISRI
jgi:hypothetical protein